MIEGTSTPKYSINASSIKGAALGDNPTQVNYFLESQEQGLVEETLTDVRSNSFVPPSKGKLLVEALQNQHLLLLCGPNHMGKAALARYLAAMLQDQDPSLCVHRLQRSSEIQDLVDILSEKKHRIILGYDVDPIEVEEILENLREVVLNTANFLVLTADVTSTKNWPMSPEWKTNVVEVGPGSPYTQQDLKELLTKRLNKARLEELQRFGITEIALTSHLASPSKIVRFAEMLANQPKPLDKDKLSESMAAVNDAHLEVRSWLRRLQKNERYLVLILALLDDLPARSFWIIYDQFIETFKKRDPTLVLLDYYALDSCKTFINQGTRISFKEAEYQEAVLKELLGQYRRSLVTLLPILQDKVVIEGSHHANRGLRIAIAEVVGQIGTVEWEDVEKVMLTWAAQKDDKVRAATGHACRQMLEILGNEFLPPLLNRLDSWLLTNTPPSKELDTPEMWNVRWTVASCLGRLSRLLSRDSFEVNILPRLSKLARDDKYQVRISVAYVLRMVGQSRFAQIRPILTDKSLHWHKKVQMTVAETLGKLSATCWPDVHNLIQEWLEGNDEDRLWTAFHTMLLVGKDHPSATEDLYGLTDHDQSLKARLQTIVFEFLENREEIADADFNILESLVRKSLLSDSYLLVSPLTLALDYRNSKAESLVTSWKNSPQLELAEVARTALQRLETIHIERRRRWQIMLADYLENQEKLQEFANSLPTHERDKFWTDVQKKRAERQAEYERQLAQERAIKQKKNQLNTIIAVACMLLVVLFICCVCPYLQNLLSR